MRIDIFGSFVHAAGVFEDGLGHLSTIGADMTSDSQRRLRPDRRRVVGGGIAAATVGMFPGTVRADLSNVLNVDEVAAGVFVARGVHAVMSGDNGGHIANLTFIVGSERVAVIDTGGSARCGAALLAAVRSKTGLPIAYVVNTHMHPDHVLGNSAFQGPGFEGAGVEFVAHAKMARGLAARAPRYLEHNGRAIGEAFEGTRIVLPTRAVDARMELDLGGRPIVLEAHTTAHTDNDLTVRDLVTGTLIAGDLVFAEHIPTIDGSLRGWIKVLSTISAVPAARVVPGHGPTAMQWPAAAAGVQRYLDTLASDVRALIKQGKTLDQAVDVAARDEMSR
ncbi:MAG: quinoprotein relay system zinc metallohydrolase 2, partial [Hyphomicrobiaceae bacterium]|nr:quinoprotein relay system zinc metallohydrolase 2 [Hyphomicrobiaceae bacterium]